MTRRQDQPRRTKSAKRAAARHGMANSRKPPALRTVSSLHEALALLIVLLTAAGAAFVFQGAPDLWDMLHARARYGVRWSGAGCG